MQSYLPFVILYLPICFFYMKLLWIKKYHISTQKAKHRLSNILSKSRKRTSAMIKFRKHVWQIARERIPILAPLQEIISWKWFISDVKIIKYSLSRRGRSIIIITEWIFAYIIIRYGSHIIQEAKHNITNIISYREFPQNLSIHTVILMIVMCIWAIWYYGMIKPWDLRQAIKEHKEDYEDH